MILAQDLFRRKKLREEKKTKKYVRKENKKDIINIIKNFKLSC